MNQNEEDYLIPQREKGLEKNIEYSIVTESKDDAENWFVEAKDRLLDVNSWKKYSSELSVDFKLMDNHGKGVNRHAKTNDFIRIAIPGPSAGAGFDWVRIEAIEYDDYEDEDIETIAMLVRSSKMPTGNNEGTAPLFDDNVTSTFVLKRRGKRLIAAYHGRNANPNADGGVPDKANNTMITTGTWLELSDEQWKKLVTGLIEFES